MKTIAITMIGAFGIFLQAVIGATGYPRVPPGIPILAAVGLIVYFTTRWAWTGLFGLILVGLITVGVFATPGTAHRLHHPEDVGSLVQLAGLALALLAGVATVVVRFLRGDSKRPVA